MNIQNLPEEILLTLMDYLHFKHLINMELVSTFFRNFIFEKKIYKKRYMRLPGCNNREYFDSWLERSHHFHIRKMVSNFYKKRLYQQLINGLKFRGEERKDKRN